MIERISHAIGRDVPRETLERLKNYVALLIEANAEHNLIARSTIDDIWERHIVDSAQLLRLSDSPGNWLDVGSGAGLPGLVIAILNPAPVTLVEPRRLRVEFLQSVVERLALANVSIVQGKTGAVTGVFSHVTARAVAPATSLFAFTHVLSRPETVWLLPKGRTAQKELDEARQAWQGAFELLPSLTDPDASILVARGVRPRQRVRGRR